MVLTDKDVAHERSRQTEHDDQDISNSKIHNEEVGNGAHSRAAVHDGDHEAVAHQAHDEHQKISHTVHRRHRPVVPIHKLVCEHSQVRPIHCNVHL